MGVANTGSIKGNVTNTVNLVDKSDQPDEVKELIKKLADQVQQIDPAVEPTEVKRLNRHLDDLGKEISSEEPDPQRYQISLDGLKKAAEAIGEIARPVVETVTALLPLLLGSQAS